MYSQFVVFLVLLHSLEEHWLHTGINFVVFEFLTALAVASHVKVGWFFEETLVFRGNATNRSAISDDVNGSRIGSKRQRDRGAYRETAGCGGVQGGSHLVGVPSADLASRDAL